MQRLEAGVHQHEAAGAVGVLRHARLEAGLAEERGLLVPGDPERKTRAERTRNGVPLPDDTWAAIVNTAREVGVSEVSIQRATR